MRGVPNNFATGSTGQANNLQVSDERGRVEEERGCLAMWRRPVSLPRSSNRTCPTKASGFPTDFIVGLTAAVQFARVVDAARRVSRILQHRGIVGRHARASCAVERGSA